MPSNKVALPGEPTIWAFAWLLGIGLAVVSFLAAWPWWVTTLLLVAVIRTTVPAATGLRASLGAYTFTRFVESTLGADTYIDGRWDATQKSPTLSDLERIAIDTGVDHAVSTWLRADEEKKRFRVGIRVDEGTTVSDVRSAFVSALQAQGFDLQ